MKLTITKIFQDVPFAHRQHLHTGMCRYLHGHNWDIEVTFDSSALDENGFILDFGRLQFLKSYISENFDHAMVLSKEDPALPTFMDLAKQGLAKLYVCDSCSAEGLAQHIHSVFNRLVNEETDGRVSVSKVSIHEDRKNKATYETESI